MPFSSPHHFGAPNYGAHDYQPYGHLSYHSYLPEHHSDIIPIPLPSSTSMSSPRDMMPYTGRIRRSRPSRPAYRHLQETSGIPRVTITSNACSRGRPTSQVWHVPDPPTWAEPRHAKLEMPMRPTAHPETVKKVRFLSPSRTQAERRRETEPSWTSSALKSLPDPGHRTGAASEHGLLSPPATPIIHRLRTPDIEPLDISSDFCNCCSESEHHVDSKRKMEMQCKSKVHGGAHVLSST